MESFKFIKDNKNPRKIKTNDCVVRAIAKATFSNWEYIYEELCDYGKTLKRMPNDKKIYELLLSDLGFVKKPMPKYSNGKRYTVKEFLSERKDIHGFIIISVANHLTCGTYNHLYDTWDCSNKCVGNYWVMEGLN